MKLTARGTSFVLLAHVAVAFQPSGWIKTTLPRQNHNKIVLNAVVDGVPDLVKAYQQKSKPVTPVPTNTEVPTDSVSSLTDTAATVTTTTSTTTDVAPTVGAKTTLSNSESLKPYVDNFINSAKEKYASSTASIVDSPREPGSVPTLADFFNGGIPRSTFTETTSIEQGKVPTLIEYIQKIPQQQSQLDGISASESQFEISKAKFGLFVDNIMHLVGGSSEEARKVTEVIGNSASGLGVPDGFDATSLSDKYVVGWGIAVFAILLAAGSRRSGQTDATMALAERVAKEVKSTSSSSGSSSETAVPAVVGVSGQVEDILAKLQEEVTTIKAETAELRKRLDVAQEEVSIKNSELAMEKQKYADMVLQLNGEIEKLQSQLGVTVTGTTAVALLDKDSPVPLLSAEEAAAIAQRDGDFDLVASSVSSPPPKANKAATKTKKATTKAKAKAKGAVKKVRITKGPSAKAKAKGTTTTTSASDVPEAKASTTTTAKTKKAASKKKKKVKVVVEVKETVAAAVEEKPATKKTGSVSNEWGALSPSTLQRKTIKELQSYLDSKGVTTTSGDGKPLKKALLVAAVQAL